MNAETLDLYAAAAKGIIATELARRDPPDRAPDDPREWLRCLECGEWFGDDVDHLEHLVVEDE